ncbi:MAG: SDR family oxidoreductase [Chitinophagales bacterium]|nr:SDR family oxidoreductase [Chitinophagales bacterium]
METLKGKRVVLAGATGDIGKQIARMLVQSGAQVLITGRNQEKLMQVAQGIGLGTDRYHAADLSKSADIDALHQKAIQALGEVDILVNAAGIGIIKPIEQLSEAEFMQTLQTNLLGAFLLVKAFLPGMKVQKKGLIINIPGVLGKVPMAGAAAYAASKYGLTGMMQSIREELKRTDIRITNLFLGGVDSAFWDTIDLRVQRDKMIVAEEAARAVWFLCQQPASGVVSEMVLQPFNHQAI